MMPIHKIPSTDDLAINYTVDTDKWECSCAHYQFRLKDADILNHTRTACKHLREALRRELLREPHLKMGQSND